MDEDGGVATMAVSGDMWDGVLTGGSSMGGENLYRTRLVTFKRLGRVEGTRYSVMLGRVEGEGVGLALRFFAMAGSSLLVRFLGGLSSGLIDPEATGFLFLAAGGGGFR